jgi:hypothetical protein
MFLALLFSLFGSSVRSECFPIFSAPGLVDITRTLTNCSLHMVDPLLPSSYLNQYQNFTVYSQIVLNNLILIDEIAGIVEMDFIYRVSWIDPRWNIPEMWKYLKPAMTNEGITITDLVRSSNPLKLWLSDNTFYDETDATVLVEAIRFKPAGGIYWTRHFVMKIAQPGFDYKKYPLDSQEIVIRISPYTYSKAFVTMAWTNPPVLYVRAKPDSIPNFMLNQIWSHDYGNYKTEIYVADTPTNVNGILIPRQFDFSFLNISVTRKEKGILIRLVAPIVALMILSGVTFWATLNNRLTSTMTILLSVSALYIAVFGQIPLIGYLSAFDRYVISMYLLLIICAFLHQFTIRLHEKIVPWPFRLFVIRSIEGMGRLFVGPFACGFFIHYFQSSSLVRENYVTFLCLILVPYSLLFFREVGGLLKAYDQAMVEIDQKAKTKGDSKLSIAEKILYQLYYHKPPPSAPSSSSSISSGAEKSPSPSGDVELTTIIAANTNLIHAMER